MSVPALPRAPARAAFLTALLGLAGSSCGEPQTPSSPARATRPGSAAASKGQSGRDAEDRAQVVGGEVKSPSAKPCPTWEHIEPDKLAALPRSPYAEVLAAVWGTVLAKHFDPTFACTNWPEQRLMYGQRVAAAESRAQAYDHINDMLAQLGVSHLKAMPPGGVGQRVQGGPAIAPLKARLIDDEVVVVDANLAGSKSGVPGGAVIEAIEDITMASLLNELRSGPGGRAAQSGRPGLATALAESLADLLHCPRDAARQIRYRDPRRKDRVVTRQVDCVEPSGRRVTMGNLSDLPASVEARMIPASRVGYLSFNVWLLPLLPEIRAGIEQLRSAGMKALVIDLRDNRGGVGAMTIPVASLLLDERADLGRLVMRGMTQKLEVTPRPADRPFLGPVALLVDERTASTSEIFAIAMHEHGRVRIFGGTRTAGMALPSLVERLPDGGLLQVAVGEYHGPGGRVAEGVGVTPDVVVQRRRSDYVSGRDPVLLAAVGELSAEAPNP